MQYPVLEAHTLNSPSSVRREAHEYRSHVEAYLRGDTQEDAFRAYQAAMGIYEQRGKGRFMVRVRIGAGIVSTRQLRRIAELGSCYGNGILHVTTRQDFQIHSVPLEDLPAVLEELLEEGLATRGGGGNTVRNVTACPRSETCASEVFDVSPYAVAVAEYLLQHENAFHLPRKFKIAFSGCADDCALASVSDVGFFARLRDGQRGFLVYAGGGLGTNPRPGIRIEEFIPAGEIFEVAEAVRRVFDRHGDRSSRHKARLRYVVANVGEDGFRELYRVEKERLRMQGLPGAIPAIREATPEDASTGEDKKVVSVSLPLGHIAAEELIAVGDIADRYGIGIVRTTQLQDLLIPGVAEADIPAALHALNDAGVGHDEHGWPKMVACTGAATCKLGICRSQDLARAIGSHFRACGLAIDDAPSPLIRISGCPSSCASHQIGAVGLQGTSRRVNGALMPHYTVSIGGQPSDRGAQLAEKVATVPAKRIPEFLAECLTNGKIDPAKLRARAPLYEELPLEIPEDYYRDFGSDLSFALPGRGADAVSVAREEGNPQAAQVAA